MRYLYSLIILFLISGCAEVSEIPITRPLSSNELDKIIKEYPNFLELYTIIQEKNNSINSYQDSLKWSNLSYKQLYHFYSTINNRDYINYLNNKITPEWNSLTERYNAIVESKINETKEKLLNCNTDSLASIKLYKFDVERFRNNQGEIDQLIKASFIIKPLRERIDSISFIYSIQDTITTFNSTINYTKPITDSAIIRVYPQIENNIASAISQGDTIVKTTFNNISLYINNILYNNDSLYTRIDKRILDIINIEKELEGNYSSILREEYIKDSIDNNYLSKRAYLRIKKEEELIKLDSLSFLFLENYVKF